MTGQIDDISSELGSLKAQVSEAARQRDAQFRKLDKISDQLVKLSGQIELIAGQTSAIKKELDEDIKPAVAEFKNLKAKGLGVIGLIALLASGVGTMFSKFISVFHAS